TAGVGRFALLDIVATTRNTPPGATESGIPSTVRVTAKPVTCTSFDTVLLSVGVRMPTALAAIKTATKAAARGPSLIPVLIDHTSSASPKRAFRRRSQGRHKPGSCMHRARRRVAPLEGVILFSGRDRHGIPAAGTAPGDRTGSAGRWQEVAPGPSGRTRRPRPPAIPGRLRPRWDA